MAFYPVNPGTLRSARELRNLTIEVAAAQLGFDVATLAALEAGQQQPTLGQLRRMAKAYALPLATLGHPDPLPPQERITDFRTIEGAPAVVSVEVSAALDDARRLQELAAELIEDAPDLYRPARLPAADLQDDPAALAARERRRLDFSIEAQLNTRDAADAFNYLRTRMEDRGVLVYLIKVPTGDCRGFCLLGDEQTPPVICVNDSEPIPEAELFTLIHEYCHLLLRAPGISGNELRNPVERFCNLFAASFLMPAELVDRALPVRAQVAEWEQGEVAAAARRLRVSQQSLALRLEELRRAPVGFYDRWVARYGGEPPPGRLGGGPVSWERRVLRRVGTAYASIVLGALDRDIVDRVEAYRMLRIKPDGLGRLREELEGRQRRIDEIGA